MALVRTPIEVMTERPSRSTANPSSSVGPKVICSGRPARKALAPQVALSFDSGDEIHPRAIHRPAGGGASALRPYRSGLKSAVERNELARRPISLSIHLHD